MTPEESRGTGSGALSCVFAGESEVPAPMRRMVGSTGFMLRSGVLRLLDDDTDVWRNVGPSFSSSPALDASDSASEISALVRARVRSVGPRFEGFLGSQKVPSLISGSDRVAPF